MKSFGIVNYMEPLPIPGNKYWRAHQIACVLSENGFKCEYYTSSFNHFEKKYYRQNILNKLNLPFEVYLCGATRYKNNKSLNRIISNITFSISLFLKSISSKRNIWIISYPHSFAIVFLLLSKLFHKKRKIIVDIRDSPFSKVNSLKAKCFNIFEMFLIELWIGHIDQFIGMGEEIYLNFPKRYRKYIIPKYFYIPISLKKQISNSLHIKNYQENNNIIFVGTLTRSFDLHEVILSFLKSSRNNVFHIVGSGPELSNLKNKFIKNQNIIFHGYKNQSEISYLFANSKFAILPYSDSDLRFRNHITNKFPEYLSYGLTTIAPAWCNSMAKVIEINKIGLIYNSYIDLDNIFTQIEKYSFSKEEIIKVYKNNFSYELFTENIMKLIS